MLLNICITTSALLIEKDYLQSMSIEKFLVENGEAICFFGEAIVHLHYNVSSAP